MANSYVNRMILAKNFVDDIRLKQDIYLFKIIYSTYSEEKLEEITNEIINEHKAKATLYDAETYLNDDILTVRINREDLYSSYKSIMFFYSTVKSEASKYWKFAGIISVPNSNYAYQVLQDFTDNWIYINLKGFDLNCRFIVRDLSTNSIFHEHLTIRYNSPSTEVQLAKIMDFKKDLVKTINDNVETENPVINDGSYSGIPNDRIRILPDGSVIHNGERIFIPNGDNFLSSAKNLRAVTQTNIAQEDKIMDAGVF